MCSTEKCSDSRKLKKVGKAKNLQHKIGIDQNTHWMTDMITLSWLIF